MDTGLIISLAISSLSLIVSVVAIIAAYFINKKVDSDNKIKELNELSEPVIEYLEQMEISWKSDGNYFFSPMHWDDRLSKIKRRLTARQAKKLDVLINKFYSAFDTARANRDAKSCAVLVKCSENLRKHLMLK